MAPGFASRCGSPQAWTTKSLQNEEVLWQMKRKKKLRDDHPNSFHLTDEDGNERSPHDL
jgi:hypothetical protein